MAGGEVGVTMSESSPAPVREGELLDDKYRVEKVLGQGGIGIVVAARHVQLDRRVALKFLLPEILANAEIVARFSREARAAAKLKSEHVTQVLDVGKLSSGAPYMVMEYLEGCDLSRLLRSKGRLAVEEAVTFVLQACGAIAEAHAAGIVHRDLKPANLFLTTTTDGSPRIKVLDFGISKSTIAMESLAAVSLTSSSAVIGTPLYMSPEQMQSARGVDGRADLWSLGAILYELIAGGPPFMANSLPQLCIAVMQEEPRPLSQVRSNVPQGLSDVVARCLTKERSSRFATVVEFAQALAPFAPPEQQPVVRRIIGTIPPPAPATLQSLGPALEEGAMGGNKVAVQLTRTPQSGETMPLDQASTAAVAAARRSSDTLSGRPAAGGTPVWAWVAVGLVVVLGGAIVLLLVGSPRSAGSVVTGQASSSAELAGAPVVEPAPTLAPVASTTGPAIAPVEGEPPSSSHAVAESDSSHQPQRVTSPPPVATTRVVRTPLPPAAPRGEDLLSDRE